MAAAAPAPSTPHQQAGAPINIAAASESFCQGAFPPATNWTCVGAGGWV